MFRCSICLDGGEALGVLRCGHVFGISCLNQHFSFRRDCPKCRTTAAPEDVRRIFLDSDAPGKPEDAFSGNEPKDLAVHLPTIEGILTRAGEMNVDSDEKELTGLIQAAERIAVRFDEYHSCFNEVLGRLHGVLSSLRNRLKYAAHLRSARAELAEALAGVGSRDEEIEHHVQEKAQLRCEADAAVKDSIRLAKRNQQWLDKYNRLKNKFCNMERRHGALHKEHERKLAEAKKSLAEKDGKVLRYKKQLYAQREKIAQKLAYPYGICERLLESMDDDDGLDISGMPGGFPLSQPILLYQEGAHDDSCSTSSLDEEQPFTRSEQAKSCG